MEMPDARAEPHAPLTAMHSPRIFCTGLCRRIAAACRHMLGLLLVVAKGRAEWRRTWRHCIVGWVERLYAARARAENRYLRSATSEAVRPRLERVECMLSSSVKACR